MKLFQWFQLILSKAERGLWYDHDERAYDSEGYGMVFKLYGGWVYRPIPKPTLMLALFQLKGLSVLQDAWNNFDPELHMMVKFWFPVLPFFSIAWKQRGLYIGFKTFSLENERYRKWGVGPEGYALTPTLSTRMTRWE